MPRRSIFLRPNGGRETGVCGLRYVMPCDAKQGVENNVVTWWVKTPAIANGEAWNHPCQVPAGVPANIAQWGGGCVVRQACQENADIGIVVGREP
jgi:hypothetical protein